MSRAVVVKNKYDEFVEKYGLQDYPGKGSVLVIKYSQMEFWHKKALLRLGCEIIDNHWVSPPCYIVYPPNEARAALYNQQNPETHKEMENKKKELPDGKVPFPEVIKKHRYGLNRKGHPNWNEQQDRLLISNWNNLNISMSDLDGMFRTTICRGFAACMQRLQILRAKGYKIRNRRTKEIVGDKWYPGTEPLPPTQPLDNMVTPIQGSLDSGWVYKNLFKIRADTKVPDEKTVVLDQNLYRERHNPVVQLPTVNQANSEPVETLENHKPEELVKTTILISVELPEKVQALVEEKVGFLGRNQSEVIRYIVINWAEKVISPSNI